MREKRIRKITRDQDRVYDYLLDIAIGHEAAYIHLLYWTNQLPVQLSEYMALFPMHCSELIALPMAPNIELFLRKELPDSFEVHFLPKPNIPDSRPLTSFDGPLGRQHSRIVSPIFLLFYETYRPWWVEKYNRDQEKWPPILRFARVVRNAIGHKMRISWDSPNVSPVEWRSLEYTRADNGKEILRTDLSAADIIHLLIDLSDELDRIGCPQTP